MQQKAAKFSKGDFVYINTAGDIGKITDVHAVKSLDGGYKYRVDYCQGKNPEVGTSGGNGPVFVEGYPKEITETEDIIFVMGARQKQDVAKLKRQLTMAEGNLGALVKVYRMMVPATPPSKKKTPQEEDIDWDEED